MRLLLDHATQMFKPKRGVSVTTQSIRRIWVYFLVNHIYTGTRAWNRKNTLLRAIGWKIGKGTKIVGPVACFGKIEIGEECWIGRNFSVHGNGLVIIDDHCDIAPEVAFFTGGHVIGGAERRAGEGETYTIRIGKGCWLGARSSFFRNISIGDSCVVAACACVTNSVEPNTLVGGVPAHVVRTL